MSLQSIFNTTEIEEGTLYNVTVCTGFFVIATFVLSIVNQFFYAYQKAKVASEINIAHNFIMLISVFILTQVGVHDLIYFVFCFGFAAISFISNIIKLQFFAITFALALAVLSKYSL